MKSIISLICIAVACAFTSCIKDEVKNAAADIESVYFAKADHIPLLTDPVVLNNEVLIMLPWDVDRSNLAPYFILSDGATINPASGTARNFAQFQSQKYTVTAEDGKWSKEYSVNVMSNMTMKYTFDHYNRNKYDVFYEEVVEPDDKIENQYIWSSGNAAISILLGNATASQYPTSAAPGEGRSGGTAAKLQTISTGPLGAGFGKPIAAGNLFIGTFNSSNALQRPLEATEFGFPMDKKPLKFKGWYKYKPGERDINGNPFNDECRIYAVIYKPDKGERLNGTNIMTSPNIVAIALFENPVATDEWMPFENNAGDGYVTFDYGDNQIDSDDLANYKYNLAVVFSSSRYGDEFKGSIGSTLLIDEAEIIYEE